MSSLSLSVTPIDSQLHTDERSVTPEFQPTNENDNDRHDQTHSMDDTPTTTAPRRNKPNTRASPAAAASSSSSISRCCNCPSHCAIEHCSCIQHHKRCTSCQPFSNNRCENVMDFASGRRSQSNSSARKNAPAAPSTSKKPTRAAAPPTSSKPLRSNPITAFKNSLAEFGEALEKAGNAAVIRQDMATMLRDKATTFHGAAIKFLDQAEEYRQRARNARAELDRTTKKAVVVQQQKEELEAKLKHMPLSTPSTPSKKRMATESPAPTSAKKVRTNPPPIAQPASSANTNLPQRASTPTSEFSSGL